VSFRNGSGPEAAATVLEARKNVGIGNAAPSKPSPDNSQVRAASRTVDAKTLRARRLLADDISYDRAYGEIMRDRPAPEAMVDALVFSLRRGVGELTNPDAQRRLAALSEDQLQTVCQRVQAFQANIAEPWSADDADLLIAAWGKFHER
jgi:hypothetical protein